MVDSHPRAPLPRKGRDGPRASFSLKVCWAHCHNSSLSVKAVGSDFISPQGTSFSNLVNLWSCIGNMRLHQTFLSFLLLPNFVGNNWLIKSPYF